MEEEIRQLKQQFQQHQHTSVDGTLSLPKTSFVTFNLPGSQAQTESNYGMCFTATRPCFVKAISEKHAVPGSDTDPVTLQIERLQETTALGSGTDLLTMPFDLKAAAYTTQRGVLLPNKTTSALNLNDSLAVKVSGTLDDLSGVQITIEIQFT